MATQKLYAKQKAKHAYNSRKVPLQKYAPNLD